MYNKLEASSDTVCVILGTSFIDQCLSNALYSRLPNKKMVVKLLAVHNGLLSEISAKNKLLFALDLVSKEIFLEIKKIASLRNYFAHNHFELSFQETKIKDICNSLKLWENRHPPFLVREYRKSPANNDHKILKHKFIGSVTEICSDFLVLGLIHKIIFKE